jgi:hypothetical protein
MNTIQIILFISSRVADPHQFNADPGPDQAFHLNADPDPTFSFNADPDPYQSAAKSAIICLHTVPSEVPRKAS